MSSRSFPSSALVNSIHVTNPQGREERRNIERDDSVEPGSPVLIPGLDILNHRPFEKVTWQWGSVNSRLVNNEAVPSGFQIFNNYGPKSNEERERSHQLTRGISLICLVIMGYGFSLADNPADHCVLAAAHKDTAQNIDYAASAAGGEHETQILHSSGHRKEQEPSTQWVRLYDDAIDKDRAAGGASYIFSPQFLHDTAMALSNKRERVTHNTCLLDQVDFSDSALSRIKLNVMCAVIMLLQKQHSDIVQYNPGLPQWPENEKQFHAARYRRGQLQILRSVNAALLDQLAGLAGMKAPNARDARVVRLENTLTESPKPLLTDYRAALNAGLGTRNAEKIKQRGYSECAFTLWVCGLWLWKVSAASCLDVEPGSRFHNGILQWLNFIDEAYNKFLGNEAAAGSRQPSRKSPNTTFDEESELLVASLLDVVRAAVKKHPTTLYNSPACTQERLLWSLNIVREESVMSPNLEGKSGDANDELLLFLECNDDTRQPY